MLVSNCVFCGDSPVTKEHVFPRWLRKLWPTDIAVRTRLETDAGIKDGKPEVAFDQTAKVVCQDNCNGGWMSQLETAIEPIATPLINGEEALLDVGQQRLLALWVCKTTYMIQQLVFDNPIIPTAHYHYLYQHREPSPDTIVWLAHQSMDPQGPATSVWQAGERLDLTNGTDHVSAYGFTFSLGCLIASVFSCTVPTPPWLVLDGFANSSLLSCVWPGDEAGLAWPPPISTDTIGGFRGVHTQLFDAQLPASFELDCAIRP